MTLLFHFELGRPPTSTALTAIRASLEFRTLLIGEMMLSKASNAKKKVEALRRSREAVQVMRRDGTLGRLLDDLAMLAFKLGRSADAARALGRAEVFFVEQPWRRQPGEQQVRDQVLVHLQRALPEEELARCMEEGAAMSDEDAAHVALGK